MRHAPRNLLLALTFGAMLTAPGLAAAQQEGQTTEELRRSAPPPPERAPRPRTERDRDQDKPRTREPQTPRPPTLPRMVTPPAPLPLPSMGAAPGFVHEEVLELDCETTRVCLLDPLDDYIAWMLSAQTTIPWRYFVDARADDRDWAEVLAHLDVATWELMYAFGQDLPADESQISFDDHEVRALATRHLGRIQPPSFSCRLPVVLQGVSAYHLDLQQGSSRSVVDAIDDDIAARIADETGWCEADLIAARRFLGDWSRVARELAISPFLFEVSFGIQLEVLELRDRVVRYPAEEQIRRVARDAMWPELTESR